MKIWLINHYAVPTKYYPLARQACFAKHLMKFGHTVTIFAASTVHNSELNLITDGALWKEEIDENIHYVLIKCRNYQGNGIQRIYNMCEFAWKLPKVCKQFEHPDAIVATSIPPMSCAVGVRMAKKYGCRGVAEIADLWPESIIAYGLAGRHNPLVYALRLLEKWIYTHTEEIVFTMEGAYDYIIEQGWEKKIPREKVHYINNGVDLELFTYNKDHFVVNDEELDDDGLFKVIYTGAIRSVNNLGLLLDVAKCINNPKIRFLIWGDGDEKEALQQRCETEKINNVLFKGRVDKKYVPSITARADLNYVHNGSSPLFRFGISFNKLFDYFAAGKPIICDFESKYNPAERFNVGVMVQQLTPTSIAAQIEAIADMSREEREKLARNAKAAALEYDFHNLTKKLLEVIGSSDERGTKCENTIVDNKKLSI